MVDVIGGGGVVRRRFQVFTYALDDFKWVQVEMWIDKF